MPNFANNSRLSADRVIPDQLWEAIRPIVEDLDPPKRTGRRRVDPRLIMEAILYRFRTGCKWSELPRGFPDDSSVHRTFQRWIRAGLWDRAVRLVDEDTGAGYEMLAMWERTRILSSCPTCDESDERD